MRKIFRNINKPKEPRKLELIINAKEEEVSIPSSVDDEKSINTVLNESSNIPTATASTQRDVFASRQTRGLQILKEPAEPGDIDVIFIHGLTGDSYRTWYHPSGIYWPTDLLSEDLPGARILSFGYDADVTKVAGAVGQGNLRNHASTLVAEYAALQVGKSKQPRRLVLITHSLGGLVTKKALCVSAESAYDEHRALDQNVVGLFFIGTPHRGSDLAGYAATMARVLKLTGKRVNEVIVDVLRPESEVLADVQESFGMWWVKNQSRCSIACFYEEHEMPGVGMIVPKKSAILEGCIPLPVPSNHRDMARFASRDAIGYTRILGQVKSVLSTKGLQGETNNGFEIWKKWLKILAFSEMHSRQNNIPDAAINTCNWILNHATFQRWLTNPKPQILWILGHPGTGKSTLMKYISERSYQTGKDGWGNHFITSFYFYNLGSRLQRTVDGLLRSVLFQLLEQFPMCLDGLSKYQIYLDIDAMDDQVLEGLNFLDLLGNILRNALEVTSVWLFIDALDECRSDDSDPDDETEEVRGLVRALTNLQRVLGSSAHHLRICCSCRHYPNIACKDDELKIFTEMENKTDIQEFIKRELREGISAAEASIAARLQNAIAKNALGSFQWTKLITGKALSMHRAGKSTAQITRQIQTAPRQLSTLYHNILKSIPQEDRTRSLQLFQWAYFSKEPLTTAQLRVLMNVQLELEVESYSVLEEHPDFIESEAQMERLVQSLSGGLVILQNSDIYKRSPSSISESSDSSSDKYSIQSSVDSASSSWCSNTSTTSIASPASTKAAKRLYLIHQSVKDYLLYKGLVYLNGGSKQKDSVASDAHFCMAFTYAVLYTMTDFTMELRKVESSYDPSTLLNYTRLYAVEPESVLRCMYLLNRRREPNHQYWLKGIYLHDVKSVARRLGQTHVNHLLDPHIWDGVALRVEGKAALRRTMKPMGQLINESPFYHIQQAMKCQDTNIQEKVLLRLRRRLIAASSECLLLWALTSAIEHDLAQFCSGVLELITDTDCLYSRFALTTADLYGSTRTVKELLRHQRPGTTENCSALRAAVRNDHIPVVELLLQAGFDPNKIEQTRRREEYMPTTALGIAAFNCYEDMCSLLLRYGASANLPDAKGQTPLAYAVKRGTRGKPICELLISYSAYIGARDPSGMSVLDNSIEHELNKWLIELAVMQHSQSLSGSGLTPLFLEESTLAKYGEGPPGMEIRLKRKKPSRRFPGPFPHPLLSYARGSTLNFRYSRQKRAVKELLCRKGAVFDQPSIENLSPLIWAVGAAWLPDYETVKTLLAHHRRFTRVVDDAGHTALDWALDYYAYIKAELGRFHPAVRDQVIWREPPYHPQYNVEPPLKLTLSKAAQAYEESRDIVRALRGIGVLCGECNRQEELMKEQILAAKFRRFLDTIERLPQQPER
ncbi:hypothetical protein HD806DRAFT_547401 [Xylariaceae sp. AK1471]|nr:hypothetical protein HD806DRAFT_547401 [Xylariaceae sp. AK1471]